MDWAAKAKQARNEIRTAKRSISLRLNEKTAEEQNTENDDNRDNDDLDQAHG